MDSMSSSHAGDSAHIASREGAVEVTSLFYSGLNEPKCTSMDFSPDGLGFLSSHSDDAVRVIDTASLNQRSTVQFDIFGVHVARYTQSSQVALIAPRFHLDGHIHLLNLETAQICGEVAYLDDIAGEIPVLQNVPVYSTLAQCPVTDVFAAVLPAKGCLAFFHPLISGSIAASRDKSVVGSKACVSFSTDGNTIVVGDDQRVTVHDRRKLFADPVARLDNAELFCDSSKPARCKGADVSADGNELLLTSSGGEVVVYDMEQSCVVRTYYHGEARHHFRGCADAIGALYMCPYQPDSCIAQPTSAMVNGRHLLVYEGKTPASTQDDSRYSTTRALGKLKYELQCKDSDVPVALAVNRRYQLMATAARNVTWWAFHI